MIVRPMVSVLVLVLVLLSAWIGAALLMAASVAPAAFAVLPTRTLAGALVGRVLPVLFWSGILLAIGCVALLRVLPERGYTTMTLILVAVACAIAQFGIAPRIERVRAAINGPVDALAPGDPLRQAFGRLHGLSVLALGVAMVAAGITLVLVSRLSSSRIAP